MTQAKTEARQQQLAAITGPIPPMFTPFDSSGKIDLDGVREIIRWFKSRKVVKTVFVRSGVGQMWTYTVPEAKQVFDAAISEAGDEIAILAGSPGEFSGNPENRPDPAKYTDQSIELVQYAGERGALGALLPLPMALDPGDRPVADVVFEYYKTVHDATDLPLFMYQPPGLLEEYRLTPPLTERLLTLPRMAGMKLTTTDPAVFGPVAHEVEGKPFRLIAGAEHFFYEALQMGACAVIGGGCNTHPELMHAVQHHFEAGDIAKAEAAADKILQVIKGFPRAYSSSMLDKMYLVRKGVKMQPYGRPPKELPPDDVVDIFEKLVDDAVTPYREAIATGKPIP